MFPLQNEYMKDDFMIKIETWHKPDMGTLENVSKSNARESKIEFPVQVFDPSDPSRFTSWTSRR